MWKSFLALHLYTVPLIFISKVYLTIICERLNSVSPLTSVLFVEFHLHISSCLSVISTEKFHSDFELNKCYAELPVFTLKPSHFLISMLVDKNILQIILQTRLEIESGFSVSPHSYITTLNGLNLHLTSLYY